MTHLDSILMVVGFGIGPLMLYVAFRVLLRRWYYYRYRDVVANSIEAQIKIEKADGSQLRGSLTLTANGFLLLYVKDVALIELAKQLEEWTLNVDDDKNCVEFSFHLDQEPETIGMLGIIPRQVGWQIHSIRPRTRRTTPISLDAHVAMAKSIVAQVSSAT